VKNNNRVSRHENINKISYHQRKASTAGGMAATWRRISIAAPAYQQRNIGVAQSSVAPWHGISISVIA